MKKKLIVLSISLSMLFLTTEAQIYTPSGAIQGSSGSNFVGIGIASPQEALQINGNIRGNQNGALRVNTGNGYIDIGPQNSLDFANIYTDKSRFIFNKPILSGTGDFCSYDNTNLNLRTGARYNTNGSINLTILNSNGNVGINTQTPGEKLEVNGTVKATTGLFGTGAVNLSLWSGTDAAAIDASGGLNSIYVGYSQPTTICLGATEQNTLPLQQNGKVTIGTFNPSPGYILTVNGAVTTGNLTTSGLNVKGDLTIGTNGTTSLIAGPANGGAIEIKSNSTTSGYNTRYLRLGFMDNNRAFFPSISIIDNGHVAIGTTNPCDGYLLTVNGPITCTEVKVVSTICSDYVFKPTYKLRPLSEVESYVKENSHLPEVPSAVELKQTGYKVGEMDDLLLRKVEELTLYVIEQNKSIEGLKKENKSMADEIEQLKSK